MTFNPKMLRGMLCLIVGGGLPLIVNGQGAAGTAPVPGDPMELVTGQIQVANTVASRQPVLQLLKRARNSYAVRTAGQAYDLKVRFTVDSAGQTDYDGAWEMEDLYAPGQGHRWTAKSDAGYNITEIYANKALYGEGSATTIPLRLQEARGALLDPVQSPAYADVGSIRTTTATLHGAPVTCVLLAHSRNLNYPAQGRAWEESEECIDPQSGLLQIHSEAPGRYAAYDYTNAPQLGTRVLPRSITITEGTKVVSKITVERLQAMTAVDASQFVPSAAMKARGQETAMSSATKITRIHHQGPVTAGMTIRPVCVFGMLTPTGQLVEAHSLQPSDPNSQAALDDVKQLDLSPSVSAGAPPRQHFVFVIEKFISQ